MLLLKSVFFFIPYSTVLTLTYLLPLFYFIFVISTGIFVVSNVQNFLLSMSQKTVAVFYSIRSLDLLLWLTIPVLLTVFLASSWTGPTLTIWFNHLNFTTLQYKLIYLFAFKYLVVTYIISSSTWISSQEAFDYLLVVLHLYLWLFLLYHVGNLFTLIFLIELLSTLITLNIVTSTFSSFNFYNSRNRNTTRYFQKNLPLTFLQSIIFYFWISLIAALNFFLFLILFYLNFLTFDWSLLEHTLFYILTTTDFKNIFLLGSLWSGLLFCIFLKCGLAPFFFWKPTFFKGLNLIFLLTYVSFFYFFFLLFLIFFFLNYLNDIFHLYSIINFMLLSFGVLFLWLTLLESVYLKTFLAMSSILNTLLIFLGSSATTLNHLNLSF